MHKAPHKGTQHRTLASLAALARTGFPIDARALAHVPELGADVRGLGEAALLALHRVGADEVGVAVAAGLRRQGAGGWDGARREVRQDEARGGDLDGDRVGRRRRGRGEGDGLVVSKQPRS